MTDDRKLIIFKDADLSHFIYGTTSEAEMFEYLYALENNPPPIRPDFVTIERTRKVYLSNGTVMRISPRAYYSGVPVLNPLVGHEHDAQWGWRFLKREFPGIPNGVTQVNHAEWFAIRKQQRQALLPLRALIETAA